MLSLQFCVRQLAADQWALLGHHYVQIGLPYRIPNEASR